MYHDKQCTVLVKAYAFKRHLHGAWWPHSALCVVNGGDSVS